FSSPTATSFPFPTPNPPPFPFITIMSLIVINSSPKTITTSPFSTSHIHTLPSSAADTTFLSSFTKANDTIPPLCF
ncbi:hypothetical protein VIGAN_06041100, partial [Vigna angularis var. angularis]